MSTSAADTLVVDPTHTIGGPSNGGSEDECIRELIIRRQMPTSSFCINPQLQTHPYDRPPPRPPRVNRQLNMQNPTMATLINTVAEARSRKRLREEEIYIKRQVGSQTEPQEGDAPREEPDYYNRQNGISCTRRLHRETIPPSAPPDTITRESIGTNTTPPPSPPDLIPSDPSPSEPSSSQPSSSRSPPDYPCSSRPRITNSLSNLTPSTQQVIRAAQRRRERDSRGSRRERRERYHQQETQRLLLENQIQQIEGVIPGHTCNVSCPHYPHILANLATVEANAPSSGPHAVSPTLAPGAFMRGGHPLATATNFPIHYPIPTYVHPPTMQVPVLTYYYPTIPAIAPPSAPVPVTAPPPTVPGTTIHAPVAIRPAPLTGATYLDILRNSSYGLLFPSFERMLDRHHMFAGLDIDVPIGAPKSIVDVFAVEAQYEKKEGEEEVEACTVCLNDFVVGESIRKLPCNHVFHPECIYKWLEINKKCPMCREDIDKSRAHTSPN